MIKHYNDVDMADVPDFVMKIIDEILEREGSEYTEHPHDWPTKYGIRKLSADRAGYYKDVRHLNRETAFKIWTALFYYAPNMHLIAEESTLIAATVIDTSGPAGLKRGITHLQEALVSMNKLTSPPYETKLYGPDLAFDGVVGPKTLRMLERYLDHRRDDNGEKILATRLNCLQDAHYTALAIRVPEKRSFSFGWNSQRVYADLVDLARETDSFNV